MQNGEKGAEVFTVSEGVRIRFTKELMEFREDPARSRMEFPSTLTNTERKFLHQLAGQLGLTSKSTGKGEDRRIVVTKRADAKKQHSETPVLQIGKQGKEALKTHLQKFPPSHMESLESKETGSSLVQAAAGGGGADADAQIASTLQQLGLGPCQKPIAKEIRIKHVNLHKRQAQHAKFQLQKQAHKDYSKRLSQRSNLPAYTRQDQIVQTVTNNPVTIIQGETGCGKSTQCPQFLLDAVQTCNIVVTQPRRISAISIAERVAQEQCTEVGGWIGYQVRLESCSSANTQLLFLTPGVLLRKLQSSPTLAEYTHIVLDEVHERDKYTEFLLMTLRDLLPQRPDLRLVLMSATLQTHTLVHYFQDYSPYYQTHPPVKIDIEGRTFPVQDFFLEHVLQMTQYIEPIPLDDNGNENPVSMEQLELELAKLCGGASLSEINNSNNDDLKVESNLTCVLCGQRFPDHITLGSHVAICDGSAHPNENSVEEYNNNNNAAKPIAMPHAQDSHLPPNVDGDFDEYQEYDEDETPEALDYDFDFGTTTTTNTHSPYGVTGLQRQEQEQEAQESNVEKWDGQGLFVFTPENDDDDATLIPAQHEQLLSQYQAMHDDETVDTTLLLEVLRFIDKSSYGEGAILVFLPGWQEISEFTLLLETSKPFHDRNKFLILPLHSGIPSQAQRQVLQRPPKGMRKIVLSTNIAETSLTIEDVAFVVDAGRAKEKDYDPHLKTSTLQPTWISQASAKQRRGRAGRTKAGVCFRLFSSRRFQNMRPFVESELLRTPLEEMCLMAKKLGLAPGGPDSDDGIPAFLKKAISPPHEKSVANALVRCFIVSLINLVLNIPETNQNLRFFFRNY